ncbi:MAG: VCBS repeat-containing protein [Planctomycetes bacterium]|nr:VCBS repeat-containing protein [Planctomycetota bacterium]
MLGTAVLPAQVFAPPQSHSLPPGFQSIVDVALGDLDGDGVLDLVANDQVFAVVGRVWTWRGLGSGAFAASPGPLQNLVAPRRDLTIADLDGDGAADVIGSSLPSVFQLRNSGSGSFTSVPTPGAPVMARVGDFTGDGLPDLCVRVGNDLGRMVGDGAGGFGPVQLVPGPFGQGFAGLAAADVERDGDLDLFVGRTNLGMLYLLRNDGSGAFSIEAINLAPSLSFPAECDLLDVDGDGLRDIVERGSFAGIAVHRNLGGVFAYEPLLVEASATDLAAADVDGDGRVEVVVADAAGIRVLRPTAAGAFDLLESASVGAGGRLALGDLDGDGGLDVVAIDGVALHVLRNGQASPRGVATFGTGTATCRGRIGIRAVTPPTLGDLDFLVSCSNTPAGGTGLLAVGTRVTNGWDPLGIDLTLHLGIAVPAAILTGDSGGAAHAVLPIPAFPLLAGLTIHMQSIWLADAANGDTCSPAWSDLASSRGLSLTLQR